MKKGYIKVASIDELCSCGHLRSEHNDILMVISGIWEKGHGICKDKDCDCQKFKWISFVAKPESDE